jgi:UDP-galactopyranose mutase
MTEQQLGYGKGVNLALMYQELFYEDFSEKVWGKPWKDLPEAIVKRVPIRDNWDDRYYTDKYQGLPIGGYTRLVEMLLHDIQVETDVDFGADYSYWRRQAEKVIYTGALDELMQEQFGRLEYRSLTFETQRVEADDVQGCPTVNYPAKDVPWTVINEWKHYGWMTEPEGHTIITTQTPAAFEDVPPGGGHGERYYPYVDEENRERHAKYVEALEEGIIPAGRLGRFQYLNMDQAVGAALVLADKELSTDGHR